MVKPPNSNGSPKLYVFKTDIDSKPESELDILVGDATFHVQPEVLVAGEIQLYAVQFHDGKKGKKSYIAHFETELEIIQSHLDKGDEVTILGCDFSFPSCDLNVLHKKKICFRCVGRRKTGMKTIEPSVEIKPIFNLSRNDKEDIRVIEKKFHQDMDIKELVFGEFDIGYLSQRESSSQVFHLLRR